MAIAADYSDDQLQAALGLAFSYLVNSIEATDLLPVARSRQLITERQRSECASEPDPYKKAEKFLEHLQRAVNGDSSKFHTFVQVLEETNHTNIASRLRDELAYVARITVEGELLVVNVPDTLVEELTDLQFAFANLQRSYEKEVQKSPEAQEQFVQFLPRLLRGIMHIGPADNSFQSNFNFLMEKEVSLFNIYYLKRICNIFSGNICAATRKLVDEYEEQHQRFMNCTTVNQFKALFPASATPSKLSAEKVSVTLKLKAYWGENVVHDLETLASILDPHGGHFHLYKVQRGCIAVIWLCSTLFVEKQLKGAISEIPSSLLQFKGVLQILIGSDLVWKPATGEQLQANGEPVSKPHKPADDQLHKARIVHNDLVTDYLPSRNIKSVESPAILPDTLWEIIIEKNTTVPVSMSLVTVGGLPSDKETDLVQRLLEHQLDWFIGEKPKANLGFSFVEVAAFEKTHSWQWYPFGKRNGYLSCFVSALEHEKALEKKFTLCKHRLSMFRCDPLDDCFYDVYRLLSSLYQDESKLAASVIERVKNNAKISLMNMWSITFNRPVLHLLNILRGYLRFNFPILVVNLPKDGDSRRIFDQHIETPDEPILQEYTSLQYLLQFTHLARSLTEERQKVCKVAAIVQESDKEELWSSELQTRLFNVAEEFSATGVLDCKPIVTDPNSPTDLESLKKTIEDLIKKEDKFEFPLSWIFFRSAFFKTGQLYIKTRKLRRYAAKCKIKNGDFDQFLRKFTAFGSIIYIPALLEKYVILNPPDFFYRMSELFHPRFDDNLNFGIATLSTLKRIFGGDFKFFRYILTSCNFAVEIDSKNIEYTQEYTNDPEKGFPISEPCLFISALRTREPDEEFKHLSSLSLLFVHDQALQPTNITVNAVKFLFEEEEALNLTLLTTDCLAVTKFRFILTDELGQPHPVYLTMISHGDKKEIRIEGDKEEATDIKRLVIEAYQSGIKKYKERYKLLLGKDPSTAHFALVCSSDNTRYHYFGETSTICDECKANHEFQTTWQAWKKLI